MKQASPATKAFVSQLFHLFLNIWKVGGLRRFILYSSCIIFVKPLKLNLKACTSVTYWFVISTVVLFKGKAAKMCCLCPEHSGGRCFWSQTIDSRYNVDTTFKGSFNKVPLEMCRFDNPIQHYTYLEFPYLHREQNWKWAVALCLHSFTLRQCVGKVSSQSSLFNFFTSL